MTLDKLGYTRKEELDHFRITYSLSEQDSTFKYWTTIYVVFQVDGFGKGNPHKVGVRLEEFYSNNGSIYVNEKRLKDYIDTIKALKKELEERKNKGE